MNLWKAVAALTLTAVAAVGVSAQGQNNSTCQNPDNGHPKNCIQVAGRWTFIILTGDGPAQLANFGQGSIDTYIERSGSVLTARALDTYPYFQIDAYGENLPGSGVLSGGNAFSFTFTKPVGLNYPGSLPYSITFTGTVNTAASPVTITGTYTNTFNDAQLSVGSGTFSATQFPDFTTATSYSGALDALDPQGNLTGTTFPVSYTIQTNSTTHYLTGTVNGSSLIDNGVSCFNSEPLMIFNPDPTTPMADSIATGQEIILNAHDNLGNYLYMWGYAVSDNGGPAVQGESWAYPLPSIGNGPYGTNKTYAYVFRVYGGPCDGWGGSDNPFTVVNHHASNGTAGSNARGRKHGNQ